MILNFRQAQVQRIMSRRGLTPEYLLAIDQIPRSSLVQQLYDSLESPSSQVKVMDVSAIAKFCMGTTDNPIAQGELYLDMIEIIGDDE